MNLGKKSGAVIDAEPRLGLGSYALNETFEVPVDQLKVNPWNPRTISEAMMESLKVSITQDPDGLWDRPCISLLDGTVIAGNHRLIAATELEWKTIPTRFKDYTEDQARVVALRDNNPWAQWDDHKVAALLVELQEANIPLGLTGFQEDTLEELIKLAIPPDEMPQGDDRGGMLALSDVSIGDPQHVVEKEDVWDLGRHVLVCTGLYDGWPLWVPLLEDGKLFVPYPTPTLPLTERADENPLVMVQPDRWLAGHVLDKYAAIHGAANVTKRAK